jgi:predicted DNA-binding protein with PD1-like motif
MGTDENLSAAWENFILFRFTRGIDLYENLTAIATKYGFDSSSIKYLIGRANPVIVEEPHTVETGYEITSGTGKSYQSVTNTDITFAGVDYKGHKGRLKKGTLVSELITGMIIGGDEVPKKYITNFEIDSGDELLDSLEDLANRLEIASGGIILTGGTLASVTLSFFHSNRKDYQDEPFTSPDGFIINGAQGTLAYQGTLIKPHVHIGVRHGPQSYGGHLTKAVVKDTVTGYFIHVPGIHSERFDAGDGVSKHIKFRLLE